MKHSKLRGTLEFFAALCALSAAAVLLAPPAALAYSLLGHELGLDERDFRVFDNFVDPEAHSNQTPHPMFPGSVGPVMAIWKASVEWGSRLHGDGSGDPTQPFDLGSGDANFDPSFQGEALGPGPVDGNVHSAVTGCNGGLVAFTEFGASGWRIRYCEQHVWSDGPDLPAFPLIDLQGLATHEYGHAIGLGHSSVPGSVMFPSTSPGGSRDLGADDVLGLQALYGAAAPSKPVVEGALVGADGLVAISGRGFTPSGNDVWFTRAAPGGSGAPLEVSGVASSAGGTLILALLPAQAGSGDVLVKREGTGHAALSNAWPLDATGASPSCGFAAFGTELGGPHTAALDGGADPAPGGTLALELSGFSGSGVALVVLSAQPAEIAFGGGTLLVSPTALVLAAAVQVTGGTGALALPLPALPTLAGARAFAQAGMADGTPPAGIALTNGLVAVVCP